MLLLKGPYTLKHNDPEHKQWGAWHVLHVSTVTTIAYSLCVGCVSHLGFKLQSVSPQICTRSQILMPQGSHAVFYHALPGALSEGSLPETSIDLIWHGGARKVAQTISWRVSTMLKVFEYEVRMACILGLGMTVLAT